MSETTVVDERGQTALLDTSGKQFNAMWVDEKQALFVPNNPLHFKAHKLQVLLARLDKQAERNGAQFNSTAYIAALNEYTRCCEAINRGENAILDEESVDSERTGRSKAPQMGEGTPASVDLGISADNPFAG